jgi:hypothetical protein
MLAPVAIVELLSTSVLKNGEPLMKKTLLAFLVTSAFGAISVPAQAEIIVQVAPPPLRYEVTPEPRRGYVWESGHWRWNGRRHVWVSGHWVRSRPGYVFSEPRWVERDGRWEYQARRWDRDGDGVPNRLDSRPNNPYRQ